MATAFKQPLATFRAVNTPSTATKATVSVAAQPVQTSPSTPNFVPYMVVTGFSASLAAGGTAATPIVYNVIDGTTGGTNVQFSGALSAPVNTAAGFGLSGLAIPIYSGTLTVEFAGAGPAASQEVVSVCGYHVNYGDV